jgi:hypothetical protein
MMKVQYIEIPVSNLERAAAFYKAVFDIQPGDPWDDGVRRVSVLVNPPDDTQVGISLNQTRNFEPSDKGALAYLAAEKGIDETLKRVQAAGGRVVEPKTSMGGGYSYATFLDTEGNLLALSAAD